MTEMSADQLADRVVRSLKDNSAAFRRQRERQFSLAAADRTTEQVHSSSGLLATGPFRLVSHWLQAIRNWSHL
jgi:hypothetical protein